ncbi:DUF6778 family protein [Maritimibacter dapengensis]|uniref:Lipoprotein n=1 Tax=Maritimibacter dapengensis TaxID=2836868 RepID=A0ABS6T2F9_9RHOB|nr:DUF6778 family protein [Maritimibacter dapengensis]MBV7379385.1 hypothetical protein [Maritimibacter dapengensis]
MRLFRILASLLALAALSACMGSTERSYEEAVVTGSATGGDPALAKGPYTVRSANVTVPESLTVSEKNEIKPRADIVWHGDPAGDRHAQVDAIMTAALKQGVSAMRGPKSVVLDVTMTRFHAVTPRTRERNPLGAHEIGFAYQLSDARTGEPVGPGGTFDGAFKSYYGAAARAAEARGVSQKVRITNYVAQTFAEQLAAR